MSFWNDPLKVAADWLEVSSPVGAWTLSLLMCW